MPTSVRKEGPYEHLVAAWGSLGYCQPIVGWGCVRGLEYPRTAEDWLGPTLISEEEDFRMVLTSTSFLMERAP